jgi:C4-dicarboxylate-specific signal transduction histidine kinase
MSLDLKKKELELERVKLSRKELEFKIEERLDEIKRLEDHIKIQIEKENELETIIKELKGE